MLYYRRWKKTLIKFFLLAADKKTMSAALCPKGGVNQMEKILATYETMYIVDSTGSEEATAALVNKFKALIEENGTIESFNEWGKRKLAYPINDMTEGYYVLVNYTAEPSFVAELERIFNITEGVMRSMTIRA